MVRRGSRPERWPDVLREGPCTQIEGVRFLCPQNMLVPRFRDNQKKKATHSSILNFNLISPTCMTGPTPPWSPSAPANKGHHPSSSSPLLEFPTCTSTLPMIALFPPAGEPFVFRRSRYTAIASVFTGGKSCNVNIACHSCAPPRVAACATVVRAAKCPSTLTSQYTPPSVLMGADTLPPLKLAFVGDRGILGTVVCSSSAVSLCTGTGIPSARPSSTLRSICRHIR